MPENIGKEAIIRVTDWLRSIWEMKRNGGQVQQWVDSIPSPTKTSTVDINIESHDSPPSTPDHSKKSLIQKPVMTVSTPISVPNSPAITMTSISSRLTRDPSLQSDSSHCSSVESLLELRRADPEAILLGLGFGGCPGKSQENGSYNRIPKRFLQPSKLKGIAIDDFMKQQQEKSECIDTASLGYRGLAGSPYVAPSEIVQKIMERLREHESHELDIFTTYNSEHNNNCLPTQEGRLSVLSPDNRQFLERQRSKSPDMRNKRMIIGQKSFAFSGDGDLIEIQPTNSQHSKTNGNIEKYENNLKSSYISDSMEADVNSGYEKCEELSVKSDSSSIEDKLTRGVEDYNKSNETFNNSIQLRLNDNSNQSNDLATMELETESSSSQRRASYGFNDVTEIHLGISHDEGRRFSDGIIKSTSNQSATKRRSLRRQMRISDADASRYCESSECSDLAGEKNVPVNQTDEEESLQFDDDTFHTYSVDESKKNICHTDRRDLCCKNDQLGQICRHDVSTEECCYHRNSTNCWRNMRKIMKKNQKLEDMVAKNRREMAEIRDMLSNVLSVRMEPGF
ncbi:hypothetical protein PV325_000055 [Microctonus aethiopoides]|nr:hypothetical protein PV325_000055 [Microctonus aethiopoides]